MPMYDAVTRQDYIRAKREADAQEQVVNATYKEYHAKAKALADFIYDNDDEVPTKGTEAFKKYRLLARIKQEAFVKWQREAQKHGAMFVDMRPREEIDPMAERMF